MNRRLDQTRGCFPLLLLLALLPHGVAAAQGARDTALLGLGWRVHGHTKLAGRRELAEQGG